MESEIKIGAKYGKTAAQVALRWNEGWNGRSVAKR